jgi:hypothetical protein
LNKRKQREFKQKAPTSTNDHPANPILDPSSFPLLHSVPILFVDYGRMTLIRALLRVQESPDLPNHSFEIGVDRIQSWP